MPWPLSQDYNEAVQNPWHCFIDPELQQGKVVTNALGLPKPCSGNFADVYEVHCPDGARWAVKCFTRQMRGLHERYSEISAHLRQVKLSFMVDFKYLADGIKIGSAWYPIVKMQWVDGLLLNDLVRNSLDRPATLDALLRLWLRMATRLREADVAHCDLQHGNVLFVPNPGDGSLSVKLIDYDGMWVPALAGSKSGEVGHAAYQHPQRLREGMYNREIDRFPLLLVATALHILKTGGRALWQRYDNGDNMLFREVDLGYPAQSKTFKELWHLVDPTGRALLGYLLLATRGRLEQTPLVDQLLEEGTTPALNLAQEREVAQVLGESKVIDFNRASPSASAARSSMAAATPLPVKSTGIPIWAWASLGLGILAAILAVVLFASREPAGLSKNRQSTDKGSRTTTPQAQSAPLAKTAKLESDEKKKLDQSPDKPNLELDDKPSVARPQPQAPPMDNTNSVGMKFVLVPRGTFWMGGGGGRPGTRQETIARDFYLGIYEVTQGQWKAVMGKDDNPSSFSRNGDKKATVKDIPDKELDQFPIENVSWEQAQKFIKRLNVLEEETGWSYRLPTEVEWEYACRGGESSKKECSFDFYIDRSTNDLSSKQANFNGNFPAGNAEKGEYKGRPCKVGSYKPNRLGIYDMHGNVWEWCEDSWDGGLIRVHRGGSWGYRTGSHCRAGFRGRNAQSFRSPDLGFRVAREPKTAPEAQEESIADISAQREDGYVIGRLKKGQSITLQYVKGKWKTWGRVATENPDAVAQEQGDVCRLAICDGSKVTELSRVLAVVPPGTEKQPFAWTADRDYDRIILRINKKEKTGFEANPDGGVTYKLGLPAKRFETRQPPVKPTFLSDLQESNVKVLVRSGKPAFSTKGRFSDQRVVFKGVDCPNAIFMHPGRNDFASVKYKLDKAYTLFRADAAIVRCRPEQKDPAATLTFELRGDDRRLWVSSPLTKIDQSFQCETNIGGVKVLELRVNCAGSSDWAWSFWLEPRLE
jgi:formylglycine-generating enzyme required for sulfatase activity